MIIGVRGKRTAGLEGRNGDLVVVLIVARLVLAQSYSFYKLISYFVSPTEKL